MQTKTEDVKSSRKNREEPPGSGKWVGPDGTPLKNKDVRVVVGQITFSQYDSLDEARTALSDEICLKHINAQVETTAKNTKRAEAVGVKSDKVLREEAYQLLVQSDDGIGKLRAASGDPARFEALMQETMKALREAAPAVETEEELAETPA